MVCLTRVYSKHIEHLPDGINTRPAVPHLRGDGQDVGAKRGAFHILYGLEYGVTVPAYTVVRYVRGGSTLRNKFNVADPWSPLGYCCRILCICQARGVRSWRSACGARCPCVHFYSLALCRAGSVRFSFFFFLEGMELWDGGEWGF